jgi:predicted transcriptional regulator
MARSYAAARFGELEIAVLEHLWRVPEATAKDVHAALGIRRGISLNTVQSTLERLYRKDLLARCKVGHAYRYSATIARAQFVAKLIHDVLGRFQADADSSMAAFLEAAEQLDDDALAALEAQLEARGRRGTHQ